MSDDINGFIIQIRILRKDSESPNTVTKRLTWALLWLHSVLYPAGSMQVFANENKIILRNLWGNMLPNTTQYNLFNLHLGGLYV